MPSSFKVTRVFVKGVAVPELVIAELQQRVRIPQQVVKALLALPQRPRADVVAIEVQEVEQEEYQRPVIACLGRGLYEAERGRAVEAKPAQLPVEIRLSRPEGPPIDMLEPLQDARYAERAARRR